MRTTHEIKGLKHAHRHWSNIFYTDLSLPLKRIQQGYYIFIYDVWVHLHYSTVCNYKIHKWTLIWEISIRA